MFYVNDGLIGSQEPDCLQWPLNALIGLFRRVVLMANIVKSRTMTCQSGAIRTGMSEEGFNWRSTGDGATYRERFRRRIPCKDCGTDLAARSMTSHHRRLHSTNPDIDWDRLPFIHTEYLPHVYEVRFPNAMQSCHCPFPGCPGTSCIRSFPVQPLHQAPLGGHNPHPVVAPNAVSLL